MSAGSVLVTGAGGYLGARIARLLVEQGRRVILWTHTAKAGAFSSRARLLATWAPHAGQVAFAEGDLSSETAFDAVDPADVDAIVHAAAVTRFNVDRETADRVNVGGTAHVVRFALRCPRLDTFATLSTIYAAGLRAGTVSEERLEDCGFANHYERSKHAAEELVMASGLPWRIFRVATVLADDETGRVGQFNAVHNTLQLLFYGLISTLPGRPATPVYLVTGDTATRIIVTLLEPGRPGGIYHVAHRREQSLTLDAFVSAAWDAFCEDETFRKRRLLRPLYLDEAAFEVLTSALTTFSTGIVGQAVSSLAPFARQLYVDKAVANNRLVAALGYEPVPVGAALASATVRELVRLRWGREVSPA